jgi:hypothetical protein
MCVKDAELTIRRVTSGVGGEATIRRVRDSKGGVSRRSIVKGKGRIYYRSQLYFYEVKL